MPSIPTLSIMPISVSMMVIHPVQMPNNNFIPVQMPMQQMFQNPQMNFMLTDY